MKFGVYYSLLEWHNRLYPKENDSNVNTKYYVENIMLPDITQLVTEYRPSVLWTDGDWEDETDWRAEEILAWLYNQSPMKDTIVVNDRWGKDARSKHGDFFNGNDRLNPSKYNFIINIRNESISPGSKTHIFYLAFKQTKVSGSFPMDTADRDSISHPTPTSLFRTICIYKRIN